MAKIILGKVIGPEGKAATIDIESTETVAPGSPAAVENVGTENAAKLKFQIPQGEKGDTGATPNLTFDVEALEPEEEPTVTVEGDAENPHLTIRLPKGKTGETGQSAYMTIGAVETLDPDAQATATITGEAPNYVLNLGLPRGKGITSTDELVDEIVGDF